MMMNQGTWSESEAVESQQAAKQVAIAWIMQRYTGPEEFRELAIETLNELIPSDKGWTFTTGGSGVCYPLITKLMVARGDNGSPSGFAYFNNQIALFSLDQCIVAHDQTTMTGWDCIASWLYHREYD